MSSELAIPEDKIALIKKMFAVGASDQELEVFLHICKRTGLDPLARQVYFVKRGGKMVIQTGIDGYRVVADRTGKYAGSDDPIFDSEERPRRASVTVWKLVNGVRCAFTATARWDQYYPGKGQSPLWDRMPHLMLSKCAEALALRKGFPQDLSGLYTHEEMMQNHLEDTRPAGLGYARQGEARHGEARSGGAGKEGGGRKPAPEPDVELPRDNFVKNLAGPDKSAWLGTIKEVREHRDPTGKKDWVLYRINLEENEDWTATTFDAALAEDAKIMIGQKVQVLFKPNPRKPGTYEYLGFQEIPEDTAPLWPEEPKEEKEAPF